MENGAVGIVRNNGRGVFPRRALPSRSLYLLAPIPSLPLPLKPPPRRGRSSGSKNYIRLGWNNSPLVLEGGPRFHVSSPQRRRSLVGPNPLRNPYIKRSNDPLEKESHRSPPPPLPRRFERKGVRIFQPLAMCEM